MSDFEDRIKLFGLANELQNIKDVIIPENETFYVSRSQPTIPGARWCKDFGRVMKPKDLRQLKEWIGVPDSAAAKLPYAPKFRMRRLPPDHFVPHLDHQEKVEFAKAYVYGNASALAGGAGPLSVDIQDILQYVVVHFARDIVVGHNAKLVYGPDNHAVHARHIKIHTGGQILVNSYMSINCTSMAAKLA